MALTTFLPTSIITSLPSIPVLFLTLTCFYLTGWILYTLFLHPLSLYPGPLLACITQFWQIDQLLRGHSEYTHRTLHAKYGPLVRIAPNELSCSDPDAIKLIYSLKTPWPKSDWYQGWLMPGARHQPHFSEIDEARHFSRRRIVNHVYSMSSVLEGEACIDRCSQLFLKRMLEFADKGKEVDLGSWVQMYTYDVLGELFFGHNWGLLEAGVDKDGIMAAVGAFLIPIVIRSQSPTYLRPLIFPLATLFRRTRQAISGQIWIHNKSEEGLRRRREGATGEKEKGRESDLLEKLIAIKKERGVELDFTDQEIIQEGIVALAAGSDTTTIAFRAVFYYLMRNPGAYQKLEEEIDAATTSGALSNPIKYNEATKLPYLTACIREAMRIWPSAGLTMSRVIPREGAIVAGHHLPGGYRIGINAAVEQYDESIFGPEPGEFRPERWLERDARIMEAHMLVFGAGTRNCIGKNIALSELYKLIPQLLREVHIELVDKEKEWVTENHWFNKQYGINTRMIHRSKA